MITRSATEGLLALRQNELMSDESIVTVVLPPNSAKYVSGRVPRLDVMAVALRNLQHAVNLCQEVIFFTDPAGMIERVDPAFEERTRYSSVEAVDLSWIAADGPMSDTYRRIWEQVFQDRAFRGNLRGSPQTTGSV
jgi:PAS domain-containing protein